MRHRAFAPSGLAAVKAHAFTSQARILSCPIAGHDLCVEVKARADGFRELYSWLEGRDVLIVIAKPTAGR